jgi:hypothetical protein
MSTEFSGIGKCNTSGVHKDSDEFIRVKAVEASLVLINTALASSGNAGSLLGNVRDSGVISSLADKIEAALKNTD